MRIGDKFVVVFLKCFVIVCADPALSSMSTNGRVNGGNPHTSHIQTNEMIQSQNDQMVEQMSGKIKQLRSVSP